MNVVKFYQRLKVTFKINKRENKTINNFIVLYDIISKKSKSKNINKWQIFKDNTIDREELHIKIHILEIKTKRIKQAVY